jgi:hypothetical protein
MLQFSTRGIREQAGGHGINKHKTFLRGPSWEIAGLLQSSIFIDPEGKEEE